MPNKKITKVNKCRACGSNSLVNLFSLGNLYVSNFLKHKNSKSLLAPLDLCICSLAKKGCGLVQLGHSVNKDILYKKYWYNSSSNESMIKELKDISKSILNFVELNNDSIVVDIGSNDNTLLNCYKKKKLIKVGFEPSLNTKKKFVYNSVVFKNYFNSKNFIDRFNNRKAKIITAVGMFYDLERPSKFLKDVNKILDNNGVFVIQMMYLPYLLKNYAFDGICHEHLTYFSLKPLIKQLEKNSLCIFKIDKKIEINEGSLRFYIKKKSNMKLKINKNEINNLIKLENKMKVYNKKTYLNFYKKINIIKKNVRNIINNEIKKGKVFHGYAASTKGNTLLQFFDLNNKMIHYISERNNKKFGLFTVSTKIKIISESESKSMKPDYFFILAWHYIKNFIKREKNYLKKGGKFIVPLPKLKIISSQKK